MPFSAEGSRKPAQPPTYCRGRFNPLINAAGNGIVTPRPPRRTRGLSERFFAAGAGALFVFGAITALFRPPILSGTQAAALPTPNEEDNTLTPSLSFFLFRLFLLKK